nr:bifunctional phosphoribosyl-AMP cyclohydrolase/phosphoribosyl-ATP diphosphatase [Bacteroidales bacterium]
ETVIEAVAGNRDRYVYEASDLLYHLLVVNNIMGVSLDDLRRELLSRHR